MEIALEIKNKIEKRIKINKNTRTKVKRAHKYK